MIKQENFDPGTKQNNMRKLTSQEFISRAKKVHENYYDYSAVVYQHAHSKIKIICPLHGLFEQYPNDHLKGHGCFLCGKKKVSDSLKKSPEQFIKESKQIHNGFYDYSKTEYNNCSTKVVIICPIHGEFKQLPDNHKNGSGCPKCARKKTVDSIKFTVEKFANRCKLIHKNFYDYSSVQYVNCFDKVKIKCPKHGYFEQEPYSHWNGHGCPACASLLTGELFRLTTEQFIQKSKQMHGDKYDYSKTIYTDSKTKVKINCKIHGDFYQNPYNHINGSGCNKCAYKSRGEEKIENWLKNKNVVFIQQKTFPDCRNPKTNYLLSFDFYLPEKNLLIEYDGMQHFIECWIHKHRMSKNELIDLTYRDGVKNKYAQNNKINLLRIPYTDIEKIEFILENQLL